MPGPRRGRLALLLPPSEGKAAGGDGPGWSPSDGRFGAALADARRTVVAQLAAVGGGDARLLGVGGATLERARAANGQLVGAPTLAAWRRFTGVVWDHLDLTSADVGTRRRAMSSVVVVSALTGLSALDDPLPDFRLKLSVRLGDLGPLARWWKPQLTPVLEAHLRGRLVIDLLPGEHAAAWAPDPDASSYRLRRVQLVTAEGRVAGHTAKAAKGRLARALLEAADPDETLASWTWGGLRPAVTPVSRPS